MSEIEDTKSDSTPKNTNDQATGHTVMIVEDSKLIRMMLSTQLKSMGMIVHLAENGIEAIKKLAKIGGKNISFILLDITMPVMDGATFMKKGKEVLGDDLPPVIVCTTNTNEKTIRNFAELGISGYIIKPFKTHTLLEKMDKIIGSHDNS